ncbi:MAG: selenocysteine-specific translation elongation factor [Chloroflexota bacterium]
MIGTAGHVDHGKSTLIEALTGTHPDRLKEEQAREMTIDLGFGWLTLPDGREVGIVDVPGHRDFIENMLAGIAGIDAALLVVAADEGIQPQTTEHLAIIDLLQIPGGIIALTKADLITDSDWLDAIEADVRAAVEGTVLQNAPMIRVSARTRSGLPELLAAMEAQLRQQPERLDLGRPRLALDRVFSMAGFGTVVTGTLSDGRLAVGDEVQVLPSGVRGRVRGIQNHRKAVERAFPGSRTSVNISGIPAEQLRRGDVLIHPGQYEATRRLDARLRLLAAASTHIMHNREVKVFIGTSESMATLRLLGTDELRPGQEGWIQLELQHPLVCARGDAFILRQPSPAETVGGGTIVDARPAGRHKRYEASVIASLGALAAGDSADILYEATLALGAAPIREIVKRSSLAVEAANEALNSLLRDGRLVLLEHGNTIADSDQLVISLQDWNAASEKIDRIAAEYHSNSPLRNGMPREELRSQLGLSSKAFNGVVSRKVTEAGLVERGSLLALPGHVIRFDAVQQAAIDALMQRFDGNPHAPPSAKECQEVVGEEIFGALKELGRLVAVSEDVVFRKVDYDSMVAAIRTALESRGQITLAEVRDLFRTSRKYAQALLEHLDSIGLTRRDGDLRVFTA